MKKAVMTTIFSILILFSILLTSCSSNDLFEIKNEGTFSGTQCNEHNPDYEVIMLESKFCSHCQETLPVFLEACAQKGITPVILDLSTQEDMARMRDEYKISIQYTPTFIFGCDYIVGAQETKEEYNTLLETYESMGDI